MADTLKVGIIGANATGAGWAARAHLPAFAAGIPGVELGAVCTTRQESAEEAGTKFGVPAYWDVDKMLAEADIDVAAVVVKLPAHYELAKKVIAAGKHIYVEWPLATTTALAEDLRDLASAAGVRTCIGLQATQGAEFLHIRRLINQGYVGDVLSCAYTSFSTGALSRPSGRLWMHDVAAGANTHVITFGHAMNSVATAVGQLDTFAALLGTQVKEWTASDTGEKVSVDAPDNILVSGRLDNGATASVHVAQVARQGTGVRLEIHGTEGTLRLEGPTSNRPGVLMGAEGDATELSEITVPEDEWVLAAGLSGQSINIGKLWKAFADSFDQPAGTFEPDFSTAVRHHQLMDRVRTSSETGQAV